MVAFLLASVAATALFSIGAEASQELRHAVRTVDVIPSAQQPEITPAPEIEPELLLARATGDFTGTLMLAPNNICGYVSGNPNSAWSCDITDKCGFATASGGWCACCKGLSCSLSQRACIDSAGVSTSSLCNSKCMADSATRKCTVSTLPYCGTLTFFNGILDYQCLADNATTFRSADTTYKGQETDYLMTTVIFAAQTTYTVSSTSSSTTSIESSGSAGSSISTASPAPNSGGSSTPIGAIVGGVVGGLALIALIAFGIWFMKSRNKKNATPAESQAMMAQAPGNGPPPPGAAPMQSPYATGATNNYQNGQHQPSEYQNGQYPPTGYQNGAPTYYNGSVAPNTTGGPDPAMAGYYQDPAKYNTSPDPNRQSYQQGPTPAAWAQHTGSSSQQVSQNTGGSVNPQYPQYSGDHSQTVYHEAASTAVGSNDPNPNHKGQLHELS